VPAFVRDAELLPHFTARYRDHRWSVTGATVSSIIENIPVVSSIIENIPV
jgi:hypothetical protein